MGEKKRSCSNASHYFFVQLHTVQAVDEDLVAIWNRLREKYERRSEAEAETAQMSLLDFAHREGETVNATIDQFEAIVMFCIDYGVIADVNLQKRMLLARPAMRYSYLKQSYLLALAAARPDLVGLKAQIRDIDVEFQKSNSAKVNKSGQAHRTEGEIAWSQGSSSGGGRGLDRGSGRFAGRDGRGGGGRGRGDNGAGSKDVTCYFGGQKGHIKPNRSKKNEKCRRCGKVGHLFLMCKGASEQASGSGGGGVGQKKQPKATQCDSFESFACEVFIGQEQPVGMIVEVDLAGSSNQPDDMWLGDTRSSRHIKSTRAGMVNVEPCPPGMRIRQV